MDIEKKYAQILGQGVPAKREQQKSEEFYVDKFERETIDFRRKKFISSEQKKKRAKQIVNELIKNMHLSQVTAEEYSDIFENEFLYKNFDDYKEEIIRKLDFDNPKNYSETARYLQFIHTFTLHSHNHWVKGRFDEELEEIKQTLFEVINEKKGNYFLNLYAQEVNYELENNLCDYLDAVQEDSEIFINKLKDKYGDDWEQHTEIEHEKAISKGEQQEFMSLDYIPFEIAPRVFAFPEGESFVVSDESDYDKILELIKKIEKYPKTAQAWKGMSRDDFLEFYEEDDSFLRHYEYEIDDDYDENVDGVINGKIEMEIDDISKEIRKYIKHKLDINDLIIARTDRTEEEKENINQNYNDFKYLQSEFVRNALRDNLGIRLKELKIKEQFYFLQFIKDKKVDEVEGIKDFAKKHGRNGLKTFLSLEFNQQIGEKILLIAANLEAGDADLIFGQYARIVDQTEGLKKKLIEQFGEDEVDEEKIRKISENILLKANCLLTAFAEKLENKEALNTQDIIRELENYNEDLLLTFSIFKGLKDELSLEDLEDVSFERVSAHKYSGIKNEIVAMSKEEYQMEDDDNEEIKEVYQMFELYKQNYVGRENFQKELLSGFAQALTDESFDTHLYIVKQQDKIVAFNRYDKKNNKEKYFGSCNVMPALQSSAIGGAMFAESIKQESPHFDIGATVDAFSPIASLYIERGNFQVERIDTESDPDGIFWFILKRVNNEKRKNYYEEEDGEDLIREFHAQDSDIEKLKKTFHFVLRLDNLEKQKETIIQLVNKEGYKITRSYFDKKTKKTYFGLERK